MSETRNYEDVDPRVQWALDAFDFGDIESMNIVNYYAIPAFSTAVSALFMPITNKFLRKPIKSGIQYSILMTIGGLFAGVKFRDFVINKKMENIAVVKHYIMTNPEKFLEPERKKYGDRVVLLDWKPVR